MEPLSEEPTIPKWRQTSNYVSRRVAWLQEHYLKGDSTARAHLASLRGGITHPIGSDPRSWQVVFDGFPYGLEGHDDAPHPAETATYAALTLFAVHMQSSDKPMHVPGVGIGTAIRKAAGRPDAEGNESPIIKRFYALGTAVSFEESTHHARGLVQQLRAEKIGFDYGQFAADLYQLQFPYTEDRVRLRWARDLYRFTRDNDTSETRENDNPSTDTTEI